MENPFGAQGVRLGGVVVRNGSGAPRQLMKNESMQSITSMSGTQLAFEQLSPALNTEIWTVPIRGAYGDHLNAGTPEPFLTSLGQKAALSFRRC